jgi:2'-5' RNA ligase
VTEGDWRVFVAVPLPRRIQAALVQTLAPMRERFPEARWTREESLHVTLHFIGALGPYDVPSLTDVVAGAVAHRAAFRARLAGAGAFGGGRRPRVAWVGFGEGAAPLAALAADVMAALKVPPERDPRPHVTVARSAPDGVPAALGEALESQVGEALTWTVDRIVVYRSHLGRGGSRYEEVGVAPLARTYGAG